MKKNLDSEKFCNINYHPVTHTVLDDQLSPEITKNSYKSVSMVIENVSVILSNGTCAVYKNYDNGQAQLNEYSSLLPSFISTILFMSRKMNAGDLEVLRMSKRAIHYLTFPTHIIAIMTTSGSNDGEARKVLEEINNIYLQSKEDPSLHLFESKLDELLGYWK
ncbi:MAG: hypothetical protein ACFFD4_20230 [Candidatus Odinarchaeota archaeon]